MFRCIVVFSGLSVVCKLIDDSHFKSVPKSTDLQSYLLASKQNFVLILNKCYSYVIRSLFLHFCQI